MLSGGVRRYSYSIQTRYGRYKMQRYAIMFKLNNRGYAVDEVMGEEVDEVILSDKVLPLDEQISDEESHRLARVHCCKHGYVGYRMFCGDLSDGDYCGEYQNISGSEGKEYVG